MKILTNVQIFPLVITFHSDVAWILGTAGGGWGWLHAKVGVTDCLDIHIDMYVIVYRQIGSG